MKFKKTALFFLTAGAASIFLILSIFSCTPAGTDKIDVTPPSSIEDEVKEPEEVEEVYEQVDFENAEIGAEMTGYIPSFLCTNSDNYIKIEIKNTSDFTWRAGGENRVRISYHYWDQNGDNSAYENNRTPLPNDLEPDESALVDVLINAVTEEGTYILQIDPVIEGFDYLSNREVEMLQAKVYFSSCTE
jgi:hypothetical protein